MEPSLNKKKYLRTRKMLYEHSIEVLGLIERTEELNEVLDQEDRKAIKRDMEELRATVKEVVGGTGKILKAYNRLISNG